jgi:hypothetical protein
MNQQNLAFKLYALRVKATKLSECIALHPPWKLKSIKLWEAQELATTLQLYNRLLNIYNQKKDKNGQNKN